ncbi:MAG: hypothetical protein AAF127_16800 [Pseudomonadota bacterium]
MVSFALFATKPLEWWRSAANAPASVTDLAQARIIPAPKAIDLNQQTNGFEGG